MRNGPWKLRIAFSNTIYSTIIWRVSCSTIDYLRLNKLLCKISSIYFWPFLADFGVITHVTCGSSKKFKIQWNWVTIGLYGYFALFSPVLQGNHCKLFIYLILRQFRGHFWVKIGEKWTFFDFPEKWVIGKCWKTKKLQIIVKQIVFENAILRFHWIFLISPR